MEQDQLDRIEALLLLNAYLLTCGGDQDMPYTVVWPVVARNLEKLRAWVQDNEITEDHCPSLGLDFPVWPPG